MTEKKNTGAVEEIIAAIKETGEDHNARIFCVIEVGDDRRIGGNLSLDGLFSLLNFLAANFPERFLDAAEIIKEGKQGEPTVTMT